MDKIIGIDLGTSTTEAAIYQNGKVVMLMNFENQIVTPSAVGIDGGGNYVVGGKAKAQLLLEPENTAIEVKRKIGSDDKISLSGHVHTAVELSAKLLDYVKRFASNALGEDIVRAVISVPAYFNDRQRQETVEAGRQAGLIVERIINEPTAAALSYGMEHMKDEKHILIYDLGGGTFDVTLLEMFEGVVEVKASSGDNYLGGKDFDERLAQWLGKHFFEKTGVALQDSAYGMVKLKEEAEKCKIALSSQPFYDVKIPFVAEKDGVPLSLEDTVTVEQFEKIIEDLVERTHNPVNVVLADSGIEETEIDMVLLVGGSTRVPLVRRDIASFLGREPQEAVDPDFAVAQGAAIQAAIISGEIVPEDGIIITDVNPYTLGLRTVHGLNDDYFSVVIPRNITIPVTRKETYFTHYDNQTEARIEVYQGESTIATRNTLLGNFIIRGLQPRPAGEERVEVEFSYNQNGILVVTARSASTGREAMIEVDMLQSQNVQREEAKMDVSQWKSAPWAKEFRAVIRRAEKALKSPSLKKEFPEEQAELEQLVYMLKKTIIEMIDKEEAEDLEEEIMDILEFQNIFE